MTVAADTTIVVPYVRNEQRSAQEFTPMVDVTLLGFFCHMDPTPARTGSSHRPVDCSMAGPLKQNEAEAVLAGLFLGLVALVKAVHGGTLK